MSSFDDEPLPPGVNPDDNKSDDENDFVSIPAPPGEEASNAPPGVIRRSDSPYSLGDSLSEPESDDGLVAPGLGDDLLPPGVEETDAPPAPPPIPPPPKFVLDDELCKKLAQRKVKCYFIETMVNLGLPKEAFEALAANPHPNLLCRELVKRHLWPPPPPGSMDDLPDLELFDDPEGPVFPEGLHTLVKRLTPLHDEEGTPLTRLPPGSVPLIEMASRLYGEALQRFRETAQPKYRIPSPEYVPFAQPDRPETPPLPPAPQPVTESKKRVKKLLEQKLAARKAQLELKQNNKTFNFSHLVNMRNALRREEKEEMALPRDDENSGVSMASLLNDDSSQEGSDVSSNLPVRNSPVTAMEEGEIASPEKPTGPTKIHLSTTKLSRLSIASPARIGAAMKRAVSPDDLPDVIVKRKERRRRWDVLPNGVKLDTADESEQTASPTESQSNLVKFEIIKAKEQSIVPKIAKATDRKDAFRKLSFGTEEEDLEKGREEEKRMAEERRAKELQEEATRQQMEAEAKAKEMEERQRRKREQQEADRKRLEELETKRRSRDSKEQKPKYDSKVDSRNDRVQKGIPESEDSPDKRTEIEKYPTNELRDRSDVSSSEISGSTKHLDEPHDKDRNCTKERGNDTAKKHEGRRFEQRYPQKRDSSCERGKTDQGAYCAVSTEVEETKPVIKDEPVSGTSTVVTGSESSKIEEKVASINPRLQELAKAMEVAVGPVGVTQERLLEMVLKTLLKEIQAPQGSNCSALAAAVASTAAADQTTSQNAAASAKDVAQGTPKATVQLKEDLSESNEQNQTKKAENILVSGDIKPQSAATVSAQNNNNSATALPDKSVNSVTEDGKTGGKNGKKKKKKKDKKQKSRRSRESTEPTEKESTGKYEPPVYTDEEVETVVDRTFKRHLRFPIFGIRITETEPPLKFSANLTHQNDFISLVDGIRPVESIVSRRSAEQMDTLGHIAALEDEKLPPELDKLVTLDHGEAVDGSEEFMESELMDTAALGIQDLEGDEEGNLAIKPVNKKNLIEIKPTQVSADTDGGTYTGNLLEVPIVCAAESTSSPSSAGQSSAVSQQDSPESTTGPPKCVTGLAAKPKATRVKSVSFFDGTVPEKDPEVRSPPPPSPSLTERRRNRQGQKVPLLPPATVVLAAQGRKRVGSPPPAPVPPPPPGRPTILYVDNPITHQLYEVIHPGNGLVMTPGGLADVRADPANHKYIYADVEGAEETVLVENFMPRVHFFPYLIQAMAITGNRQ